MRSQVLFCEATTGTGLKYGPFVAVTIWCAAALAAASDAKLRDAFWTIHRQTIVDARRPVGSFAPREWIELDYRDGAKAKPRQVGSKNNCPDLMYGDAWMLLIWQIALDRSVLTAEPADAKASRPPAPAIKR